MPIHNFKFKFCEAFKQRSGRQALELKYYTARPVAMDYAPSLMTDELSSRTEELGPWNQVDVGFCDIIKHFL